MRTCRKCGKWVVDGRCDCPERVSVLPKSSYAYRARDDDAAIQVLSASSRAVRFTRDGVERSVSPAEFASLARCVFVPGWGPIST